MVQSLLLIALASCCHQAGSITDVGAAPYHLIQPALRRLNAKQLALLEENSSGITPDSDELWGLLVEKDFADRPLGSRRNLAAVSISQMPNKDLYMQYSKDREKFRENSALRLRRITEKLQREKSKNSIVPLQEIIAEPVVHRRTLAVPRPVKSAQKYANNSIMGKAFKDMEHRLLMFGGLKRTNPYAAFLTAAFRNTRSTNPAASILTPFVQSRKPVSIERRPWTLTQGRGIYLISVPLQPNAVESGGYSNISSNRSLSPAENQKSQAIDAQQSPSPLGNRKRKRKPSLLDNRQKEQRPRRHGVQGRGSVSPSNEIHYHGHKRKSLVTLSNPTKQSIRSSIFN